VKLAILQCPSPGGDETVALAALQAALRASAAAGARLLVAPELMLPGYNCGRHPDLAQSASGPWRDALCRLCAESGCGIVVGFAERDGDRIYNSAMAIDAGGSLRAVYRKIQLFGAERGVFSPGDAYGVVTLEGIRVGLLICYDVEFAAHVRALAEAGAELIAVPTANMLPYTNVSSLLVPARAAESAVAIAYANYCGAEGDLAYAGGSLVAAADGSLLALAGHGEALLVVDLAAGPQLAAEYLSRQSADYRAIQRLDRD
jgi:5-aminopentanamidase